MQREGADIALTYQAEAVRARVEKLAEELGVTRVYPCDVANDSEIDALFGQLGQDWEGLDGLIHSIAYVPREALSGDYLDAVTRENFRIAHDVSSYSFSALAKAGYPLMAGRNGALILGQRGRTGALILGQRGRTGALILGQRERMGALILGPCGRR